MSQFATLHATFPTIWEFHNEIQRLFTRDRGLDDRGNSAICVTQRIAHHRRSRVSGYCLSKLAKTDVRLRENVGEPKRNRTGYQFLAAIRNTSTATAIFAVLMLLASVAATTQWINACAPNTKPNVPALPTQAGMSKKCLLRWNYRKAADVRGNRSFLLFSMPVADDFAFDHVNHVFGDIRGHIGQPFQVP